MVAGGWDDNFGATRWANRNDLWDWSRNERNAREQTLLLDVRDHAGVRGAPRVFMQLMVEIGQGCDGEDANP
jgi:hypothetical protein